MWLVDSDLGKRAVSISIVEAWSMTMQAAGLSKYCYLCMKQHGVTSQARAW
jgi:hypothetical protein